MVYLITVVRVILLHGPAGTGKTTLCKALSQKLAIRLRDKFKQSFLIEINAHSLFSKWFSESGKLVMKMFSRIKEYTEDEDTLVCVLIGTLPGSLCIGSC
jgi:SpoVK/Ycf46/Vps4 family AAA+-type ATPase